jgi:hypothetical protein
MTPLACGSLRAARRPGGLHRDWMTPLAFGSLRARLRRAC